MTDAATHRRTVEAWREQRYSALRRDTGWLTLAGFGWLRPGVNRVGSAPDCDVVLPSGPSEAGSVEVATDGIYADGAFMVAGSPARRLPLTTDRDGDPTMLELGTLRLSVIERGGRLALRMWDVASITRAGFDGIDHWPVHAAWRVNGRFEPTAGRVLPVPDVLGMEERKEAPGDVVFEIEGETHRLQALRGGDAGELWLVFGDATNGTETYGGGRFLYISAPDRDGGVVIDFNRAYNPPCVFSPFATCPLPWRANRLSMPVEAGERRYLPRGG
ncbi:MAG: DUF1684 domain-containing protein [Candidatus Limnocylindria bacterium]